MLFTAVPREEMSAELQGLYDHTEERTGDTRLIGAGANAPEVLDWFFNSYYKRIFYGGRVDVRIKEMVRLRLSRSHGCEFCNKWNTVDTLEAGVSPEAVAAITAWPDELDEQYFSARELAALRFADQMTIQNMDGHLDEALYGELREHFNDAEVFELGMALAMLTGMAKFVFTADLVHKESNCPVPSYG